MKGIKTIILFLTAIVSALMAGLFYAYTFSVMPGLAAIGDSSFVAAMQSINRAIQNPVFFIAFFGTPILLPISTYQNFSRPLSLRFRLLLSATFVYWIGVLVVTMFGNIPLNDALDKFDMANATADAIASQRQLFERSWNSLNNLRTISSVAAVALVIAASLSPQPAAEK